MFLFTWKARALCFWREIRKKKSGNYYSKNFVVILPQERAKEILFIIKSDCWGTMNEQKPHVIVRVLLWKESLSNFDRENPKLLYLSIVMRNIIVNVKLIFQNKKKVHNYIHAKIHGTNREVEGGFRLEKHGMMNEEKGGGERSRGWRAIIKELVSRVTPRLIAYSGCILY